MDPGYIESKRLDMCVGNHRSREGNRNGVGTDHKIDHENVVSLTPV